MNTRSRRARMRHYAVVTALLVVLAVVLYLALIPNTRGNMLGFLPMNIRRWICEHDDFNNVMAFLVLGSIAFRVGAMRDASRARGIEGIFVRVFAHRLARLAGLMALVCILETAQLAIPGRMSGLRDVCTGWSGLFAAWLISELLGRREEPTVESASAVGHPGDQ